MAEAKLKDLMTETRERLALVSIAMCDQLVAYELLGDKSSAEAKTDKKAIDVLKKKSLELTGNLGDYWLTIQKLFPILSKGSSSNKDPLPSILSTEMFQPDKTDLTMFFETLEGRLMSGTAPEIVWYKMLGKATNGDCLLWVKDHILNLIPPPTWTRATELFAAEYTPVNYEHQCRTTLMEYQQNNLSGATFLRTVERLAKGASENVEANYFKHNLIQKQLDSRYRDALITECGGDTYTLTFAQLKTKILFFDSHFTRKLKGITGTLKRKPCTVCGMSNHTTEQHKDFPKKRQPRQTRNSGQGETKILYIKGTKDPVVCVKCNGNHYPNDERCPNHRSNRTTNNYTNKNTLDAKAINRILALKTKESGEVDVPLLTNEAVASAVFEMRQQKDEDP